MYANVMIYACQYSVTIRTSHVTLTALLADQLVVYTSNG